MCQVDQCTYRSGLGSQRLPPRLFGGFVFAFPSFTTSFIIVVLGVNALSLVVQFTWKVAYHTGIPVKIECFVAKVAIGIEIKERTLIIELEIAGARSTRHARGEIEILGGGFLAGLNWRMIGIKSGHQKILLTRREVKAVCG